jgi:Tol biopolymer transport system component
MNNKRTKLILIIGGVLMSLMIFVSQISAARNGKIAFGSTGDIYTMNPDGSGRTEIASSGSFPTYSPDGSKIAFYRRLSPSGIYLMDADGSNQTLLAATTGVLTMKISWSPDGKRIAFTCGGICFVNADGSNLVTISDSPKDFAPDWSPDGLKIAFNSKRHDNGGEIYKMNIDGSQQERLTFNGYSEYPHI